MGQLFFAEHGAHHPCSPAAPLQHETAVGTHGPASVSVDGRPGTMDWNQVRTWLREMNSRTAARRTPVGSSEAFSQCGPIRLGHFRMQPDFSRQGPKRPNGTMDSKQTSAAYVHLERVGVDGLAVPEDRHFHGVGAQGSPRRYRQTQVRSHATDDRERVPFVEGFL